MDSLYLVGQKIIIGFPATEDFMDRLIVRDYVHDISMSLSWRESLANCSGCKRRV